MNLMLRSLLIVAAIALAALPFLLPAFQPPMRLACWGLAAVAALTALTVRGPAPATDAPSAKRPSSTRDAPQKTKTQWISMHRALRYLVYQSDWAFGQRGASSTQEFDRIVATEFRAALARGDVAARGRRGIHPVGGGTASEPIPTEFWNRASIQPHAEIAFADKDRCVALIPRSEEAFHHVIVKASEVAAVWPPYQPGENGKKRPKLAERIEPYLHLAPERAAKSVEG